MFASPFRKAPRRRLISTDDAESLRELRQAYKRKSDTVLFGVVLVAPLLLYFTYELGRTVLYVRGVKTFATTIDQLPQAEVKREVQGYASHLGDFNPAIRNASVMAMKLATGWNPGNSPGDWRRMWAEQGTYWEYRHAITNAAAPDWRSELPEKPAAP